MELKSTKDVDSPVPHYKIFPGRSTFCCDGRLQTSKNWLMIPFVLALIIVPCAFHLAFDAPTLAEEGALAVPIIGGCILIATLVMYIVTAFTEPGYLPRSTPEETVQTEKENDITVDLSGAYYPTPKLKTIDLKGIIKQSA
jgi:palmitoyltransferase ZDHHC9/14/18